MMCGLAGMVFAPAAEPSRMTACLARLRHRGPDGDKTWSDETAWLAHTRLRILDTTTAADQPMCSRDGRAVLLYNGEVYNYRELRRELGNDWQPRTASDTEVVVEMLARHGTAALSRFNGMWAIALWMPGERRLLLARDRFGVKPLYYTALRGGGFAFASEPPALLALGGSAEPDLTVLQRFLHHGEAEPREATFVRGLVKLPPACVAEITAEGIRVAPFWDLRSAVEAEPDPGDPVSEYRQRFHGAVRLRLRSDVPVGTCLSGGLDSSSIVGAVSRAAAEGALEPTFTYKAFSARHPGTPADEGPFIEAVVQATRFKGHAVVPQPARFEEEITRLVRHQGEPFGSLAVYAQWCVMRLARENDVTVLLDGQGADEVLGGYPFYAHYRLQDLARGGHLGAALRLARTLRSVQGVPVAASLRSAAAGLVPRAARARLRAAGTPAGAGRFLAGAMRERPTPAPDVDVFPDRFRNALFASVTEQGLPSLLRYEDRNSMAFSIEARVPFLDWRLVALGLRLGPEWKLHDGWTKWILREAMAEDLPAAVRWRRDKKAFATPQAQWLSGPLASWVWPILRSREMRERGWFDVEALVRGYGEWLAGGPAIDGGLWLALSAELWARQLGNFARPAG